MSASSANTDVIKSYLRLNLNDILGMSDVTLAKSENAHRSGTHEIYSYASGR